jgi:hypothetical protein
MIIIIIISVKSRVTTSIRHHASNNKILTASQIVPPRHDLTSVSTLAARGPSQRPILLLARSVSMAAAVPATATVAATVTTGATATSTSYPTICDATNIGSVYPPTATSEIVTAFSSWNQASHTPGSQEYCQICKSSPRALSPTYLYQRNRDDGGGASFCCTLQAKGDTN